MTIHLDGVPIKGLLDTGAYITIIDSDTTSNMQWEIIPGPNIQGVGGLQPTRQVSSSVIWQDLIGKKHAFHPLIADVPNEVY